MQPNDVPPALLAGRRAEGARVSSLSGTAILTPAMRRVSVAEAKNTLAALLREAESAPVEITRHGRPVAVILSRATYDRLRGKSEGVWTSLERFRKTHDLGALDATGALADVRCPSAPGRSVRW
jgi:prevent-host-death family protein